LDAELAEVDGLRFADAAVHDARDLDASGARGPDLEVARRHGAQLRARRHRAVVGRVRVGRARVHLDPDDDVGVAEAHARAAFRLLDVPRTDADLAELVERAPVVALAVLGEL